MSMITKIDANKNSIKWLRVAAYARVSTNSDEQLLSLEIQKEHYEKYIKAHSSWKFAGLYFDEGISGTKTENRKALLRLIKDCENGLIDKIITKSISRFSRNTTDCLKMVRKLSKLGVYIFFEKENIDTEHMSSELILTILSSLAEGESRSISQNIKWSIKRRFEEGTYVIATPPYGYKNKEGKLVIEPNEAEVIRRIFESSISGKGSYTISNELNAEGIKTRRGKKWHSSTVRNVLTNEKYIGDVIFQKTFKDENFRKYTNNGEKDMYLIENNHEGIISKEVFYKAAEEMKRRAKEKGITKDNDKYKNHYPLSKLIHCSQCGSTFKRRIHYRNKSKVIYWTCQKHLKGSKDCSMLGVKEEDLLKAITKMLRKLKQFKNQILKPLLKALEENGSGNNLSKISEFNKKIESVGSELNNVTQLFTSGHLEPELYHKEKSELSTRIKELKDEKNAISKTTNDTLLHIDETRKLIKLVTKQGSDFNEDVINEVIEKVEVLNQEEFIIYLKCGLKLKEGSN